MRSDTLSHKALDMLEYNGYSVNLSEDLVTIRKACTRLLKTAALSVGSNLLKCTIR